jgi:Fe-Mn family superoxide dismutase
MITNLRRRKAMDQLSRRDLLAGAAALAVAAGLASGAAAEPAGVSPPPSSARAYLGGHKPQALPFDPTKLDGLSEKLIRSHWENNYQGAINALNAIEPKIPGLVADKDWPPYLLGNVKREELLRTGSMIMHGLYFGNLGGDGKPSGDIARSLGEYRVGGGVSQGCSRVGRRVRLGNARDQSIHR